MRIAYDKVFVHDGAERDNVIEAWCQSVWAAFSGNRQTIIDLLREYQMM